jgi:hypothetical protein
MFALIFPLGLVAVLHLVLHLSWLASLVLTGGLWLLWKLKYVILALVGIGWLLDRER